MFSPAGQWMKIPIALTDGIAVTLTPVVFWFNLVVQGFAGCIVKLSHYPDF